MTRTTILQFSLIISFAATATDIRPVLPPVEYPDTEVVTNVAISAHGSREYAFELAFSGTASNNVEIAFGADVDGDGALSVDEIWLSAGWDCGEWFILNAATGERMSVASTDGAHNLIGKIRLRKNGCVREMAFLDGVASLFPTLQGAARLWTFPAGWNMVRLVGRGENVRSGESFHVTAISHGLMFRLQ